MSARMRWITFDCFGTLVDWQAGFAGALRPLAGEKTADLLEAYYAHEAVIERTRPHRSYKEVLVTALALAARECDLTLSVDAVRTLPEAWSSMRVFDDVEPMLAGLRAMGYKLAVLTNCDEDLFSETQRAFRERFDLVVTAERVRDYKPSPAHFRYFLRSSGVTAGDWVHVACSWYHDIAPARDLGINRIWLDRDGTGEDPATASVHVRSAADVCGAAAGLCGRRAG